MMKSIPSTMTLLTSVLFGAAPSASTEAVESTRIAALRAELDEGAHDAAEAFWSEVGLHGAPLVETLEGDRVLVTFLWRSSEPLDNVVVVGGPAGYSLHENVMTHLPESDVWYRSYQVRRDLRTTYRLAENDSLVPLSEAEDIEARVAGFLPDPLNPKTFIFDPDPTTEEALTLSLLELPDAPPQPWVDRRADVAAGTVEDHELASDILDNERAITVYLPPHYDAKRSEAYPLLVLFDRGAYLHALRTPVMLDNLIDAGEIPPLVAVFVGNVERNKELPCYAPFANFLAHELVPWLRKRHHVTWNPSRIVVAGSSYGGLASTYAAFMHPAVFGNVLSQSGSYWWTPADDTESEWLTRQLVDRERAGIRFYMDIGLMEAGPTRNRGPSMLVTNRHMRDVLRAKGYSVTYREVNSGHDYVSWRGTLADGLIALIGEK